MEFTEDLFELLPKKIEIREVGPREGLQSEKKTLLTTDQKVAIINALEETGVKSIQVGSLVHPKLVPQMADTEEVFARVNRKEGVALAVLVPNVKGAERALKVNADEWNFMLSVSDAHSLANANATTMEAMDRMIPMMEIARSAGVKVNGGMGTALGCPFQGEVPLSRLFEVVERYLKMGITNIGCADTAGMANPRQVYHTAKELVTRYPEAHFKMHIHNTRGLGIANIMAGMFGGFTSFDTAVGGFGGCPFVPGATGNVATEDLVHMLDMMGIETGVDVHKMVDVAKMMEEMFGHPCFSAVSKAGTSADLHDFVAARKASAKAAKEAEKKAAEEAAQEKK